MRRPIHVWLLFAACLAVLAGAMAWVTAHALRLERNRHEAAMEAEHQERTRLAMWRLDFTASGLIIAENARAPQEFKSFHADDSMFNKQYQVVQKGEVLRPSPLLNGTPENVLLHFQIEAASHVSSPQAPEGNARDIAESYCSQPDQFKKYDDRLEKLRALLTRTAGSDVLLKQGQGASAKDKGNAQIVSNSAVLAGWNNAANGSTSDSVVGYGSEAWSANRFVKKEVQQLATDNESQVRTKVSQRAAINNYAKPQVAVPQSSAAKESSEKTNLPPLVSAAVDTQPFHGFWLDGALLLTREATVDGTRVLQGVWLDWEQLRARWIEEVRDLFPNASLVPAEGSFNPSNKSGALNFATLPIRLETGAYTAVAVPKWNALTGSLVVAWACVCLAGGVAAYLLHRTLTLSERRAAFVSSVTHELRTPLTTFRLYSEMLADGMVGDEATEKAYLGTLSSEATRLSHLVENVLSYARLERGSARRQEERGTVGGILRGMEPRLGMRAESAGMKVEMRMSDPTADREFCVDAAALEQILFNLVDNACKYAGPTATDKRIEIVAESAGSKICLRVRDHGPGISKRETKRVFLPFHKSADQAAHTQPGVGLGLALCQRLARELGGAIRLCSTRESGACFELEIPLTAARKH